MVEAFIIEGLGEMAFALGVKQADYDGSFLKELNFSRVELSGDIIPRIIVSIHFFQELEIHSTFEKWNLEDPAPNIIVSVFLEEYW